MAKYLVCGGGGFIGHWLTKRLKADGHWVRAVDIKHPEYEKSPADQFLILDLREYENCLKATEADYGEFDGVFQLAASMGGIGFIESHLSECARNILITIHMLEASRVNKVKKFLFSSSACVYNASKQNDPNVTPLKEEDAYPAMPEPGYGWEKLYAELMCSYYKKDFGLDVRIVRFHNVYGPLGTYDGGKEKAPAAVCRKLAYADNWDHIEVWGDGEQTRSFMYVDDCVEGLIRLMASDYSEPLNLGTDELTTINALFDRVGNISGKFFVKDHDLTKPQGVRGRNSDNSKLREVLGWEPKITLDEGLVPTYEWIEKQVAQEVRVKNFYKRFMNEGNLIFDIGANVGTRTETFRKLGCKVVAVEPHPDCLSELKSKFGSDPSVTIIPKAAADRQNVATLFTGECTNISSLSKDWIRAVVQSDRFGGNYWTKFRLVETTTLDALIADHGIPSFIKIDVEGFEDGVLAGLSQPVKYLSFEFHPEHHESTVACVKKLESLGQVQFTYSVGESMETHPDWVSDDELLVLLNRFEGNNKIYGDIYAKFV